MRILFCSPNPLTKEQGAAKVLVELAEEMEAQGWECDLIGPTEICTDLNTVSKVHAHYAEKLRYYLQEHAARYDVVDYDHTFLPFPRDYFSLKPLFVARSVLLAHHLETIPIPFVATTWKSYAGRVIKLPSQRRHLRKIISMATRTVQEADLVNVSNNDDKDELIRRGIPGDKIAVIPFGISSRRRPLFDAVSGTTPSQPRVAFVGTFDARKGAKEFPRIVQTVLASLPTTKFKFLGVGLRGRENIFSTFSASLHSNLEIVPQFQSSELPELLADCSVGVFPSHMEGFGFGVLEMLAASVPVVAYNVPGPPMMLPNAYLVPRGDAVTLGHKLVDLLQDPIQLHQSRKWARQRSQDFCWQDIAEVTGRIYSESISNRSR